MLLIKSKKGKKAKAKSASCAKKDMGDPIDDDLVEVVD